MGQHIANAATRLLTSDVIYPESPRWRGDRLWFSDVHDYTVKTVDLHGTVSIVTGVPGRPGGLGFLPDGRLLIAGALDKVIYQWDGDSLTVLLDLSSYAIGLLNDMVVDGQGRAYVGDTGFNLMAGEEPRPGQIIVVNATEPDSPARVVADDVMFPNGAAISQDGARLWVAESTADRVARFAVSADGSLQRTATFDVPDFPDGLCLDSEENIWVALLRHGQLHHICADGSTDTVLTVPGKLAIACALGGADRRKLFVCSADTTMADLAQGRSAGLISTLTVQLPGTGFP